MYSFGIMFVTSLEKVLRKSSCGAAIWDIVLLTLSSCIEKNKKKQNN